jgi:hypothetical protein
MDQADEGDAAVKTYLCVVDLMPSGSIAAIEIRAVDAIAAERAAQREAQARYGGTVQVLEVLRTDVPAPTAA